MAINWGPIAAGLGAGLQSWQGSQDRKSEQDRIEEERRIAAEERRLREEALRQQMLYRTENQVSQRRQEARENDPEYRQRIRDEALADYEAKREIDARHRPPPRGNDTDPTLTAQREFGMSNARAEQAAQAVYPRAMAQAAIMAQNMGGDQAPSEAQLMEVAFSMARQHSPDLDPTAFRAAWLRMRQSQQQKSSSGGGGTAAVRDANGNIVVQ